MKALAAALLLLSPLAHAGDLLSNEQKAQGAAYITGISAASVVLSGQEKSANRLDWYTKLDEADEALVNQKILRENRLRSFSSDELVKRHDKLNSKINGWGTQRATGAELEAAKTEMVRIRAAMEDAVKGDAQIKEMDKAIAAQSKYYKSLEMVEHPKYGRIMPAEFQAKANRASKKMIGGAAFTAATAGATIYYATQEEKIETREPAQSEEPPSETLNSILGE